MILTIIIAFAAVLFGFIIAGLMAEAKRNDKAEEVNGKNTGK